MHSSAGAGVSSSSRGGLSSQGGAGGGGGGGPAGAGGGPDHPSEGGRGVASKLLDRARKKYLQKRAEAKYGSSRVDVVGMYVHPSIHCDVACCAALNVFINLIRFHTRTNYKSRR